MTSWQEIWSKKGSELTVAPDIEALIRLDGFDIGAGRIAPDQWQKNVEFTAQRLGLKPGSRLLEIGCGSGAFLFPLRDRGLRISAIDYSPTLIAHARQAIPGADIRLGEARSLDIGDGQFDAVIVNGVIHYFDTLDYAKDTFAEIARVLASKGRAAILDICDAETRDACEEARRRELGAERYDRLYAGLPHLFYERDWVRETASALGLSCSIEDVSIEGYGNAAFRFNAFLEKP